MSSRFLPVFDSEGRLEPSAPHILFGFMNCPENSVSARQLANVLALEEAVQKQPWTNSVSEVSETVLRKYQRRKNRADLAGYVVLFMADLIASDIEVSLSRAVAVTEAFAGDVDEEFKAGLPLTNRDIRKHFTSYKNVAHYWAAKIQFPEKFLAACDNLAGFSDFMAHAKLYEIIMEETLDLEQTDWFPWRVPSCFLPPSRPVAIPKLKNAYLKIARNYSK